MYNTVKLNEQIKWLVCIHLQALPKRHREPHKFRISLMLEKEMNLKKSLAYIGEEEDA